jgi:hypothetical protein
LATEAEATTLEPAPPIAEAAIEDLAPLAAEVSRSEEVQPQLLSAGPEAEAADGAQAQPADPPVARLVDDLLVEDQAHSLIETALDKESSEDGVPETQAFAAPPATAPEDETADRGESPAAGAANDEAEPVESQAIALANDEMAEPAESPAASAANDEPESVESQAIALANDEVAESAELKAIAALNDEAAEPIDSIATAAAKYDAPAESIAAVAPQPQQESRPQQESNAAPTGNEPEGEAANAAFAAETAVPVVIEARGEQEPPQRASSLSVGEGGNAAAPKRDRPANDPLAALYGLSEEELIAVFC